MPQHKVLLVLFIQQVGAGWLFWKVCVIDLFHLLNVFSATIWHLKVSVICSTIKKNFNCLITSNLLIWFYYAVVIHFSDHCIIFLLPLFFFVAERTFCCGDDTCQYVNWFFAPSVLLISKKQCLILVSCKKRTSGIYWLN